MTVELERAEAFLQEAVYRARARQAASVALAQAATDKQRQCGLGERTEPGSRSIPAAGPADLAESSGRDAAGAWLRTLDLSPRAAQLARELWPAGLAEARVEQVRRTLAHWIQRQDALDRDRNHFLKAFRQAHGFDRNTYTPEQRAAFEAGLERVNAQVAAEHRAAAASLLA